jgi:alkanesulfonate monooxygenase SsuD/methylene tetrahydromethanopterin reductase-like flavin-dependent oxidoreductase (luciferase family)
MSNGAENPAATVRDKRSAGEHVDLREVTSGRAVVGTPEDCIREIQRCLAATGCDYVSLNFDGFKDEPGTVDKQLRLFAAEVMPVFA